MFYNMQSSFSKR